MTNSTDMLREMCTKRGEGNPVSPEANLLYKVYFEQIKVERGEGAKYTITLHKI